MITLFQVFMNHGYTRTRTDMARFWNRLPIRGKIITIGVFVILLFSSFQFLYFIPAMRATILQKEEEKVRSLIKTAYSIAATYHLKSGMKLMDEEKAKTEAQYQFNKMRFGDDDTDTLLVMNADSMAMVFPYRSDLEGVMLRDYPGPDGSFPFKKLMEAVRSGDNGEGAHIFQWQWKNEPARIEPYLAYAKEFKEWGWMLVTGAYLNELENKVLKAYLETAGITGIIIIIAAVFLFFAAGRIATPINVMVESLKTCDLNTTLTAESQDEIMDMAEAFNAFTRQLRDVVVGIRESSNTLAASAEEMSAVSMAFSQNAIDQNSSADRVTITIGEITNEMDRIATDIDKEFENLKAMILNMDKLSHLINNLSAETRSAQEVIRRITGQAREGESALGEMNESMKKIGNSSLEMNGITTIIGDISDKINLLSLNAAIEAARAGQAGRGFAVVADEIAKLAAQTAASIRDITRIIAENDGEINGGFARVERTINAMRTIIDGVNAIGQMIEGIGRMVMEQVGTKEDVQQEANEIQLMSEGIRMTTKVQRIAIEDIKRLIANITASSNSITAGAEELASSTEEVAGMAETFRQKVDGFRI
ncbi:MAG: methyl-accepting chemotaxis protein [Spirochaetes bacterium]|nr:MAG: methyl-accepting chemotaxis protein [Spirochaetota bacterium]